MIVSCIKELQEANEEVRRIHQELYTAIDSLGSIWNLSTCKNKGCFNCKENSKGELVCTEKRCYHNRAAWAGCRIPYMDYCTCQTLNGDVHIPKSTLPKIESAILPEKVDTLIKVENRMPGVEVHVEAVQVVNETDNCYELKNGDFIYKRNGERRSIVGKSNNHGKITVRYYPPSDIDNLQDCPNCGKSIFFPFEVIKKPESSTFNPVAKVCPHCGFKISISKE